MKKLQKILRKQNRVLIKENIRKIKNNKHTFIISIILLTVMISLYSTLLVLEKNINKITKTNYDDNNIMDILITSNIPFSGNNFNKLNDIKSISGYENVKEIDSKIEIKNKKYAITITNINLYHDNNDKSYINKLKLKTGKYPKTINEGLIDDDFFNKHNLALGDLVTIIINNESMIRAKKIRIVGTVKQEYQTHNNNFMYLQLNNISYGYYNKSYVKLNNTNKLNNKKYLSYVNDNKKVISDALIESMKTRQSEYIKELDIEINRVKSSLDRLYKNEIPEETINEQLATQTNYLASLEEEKNNANELKIVLKARNDISSYQDKIKKINNLKLFLIIYISFCILLLSLNIIKIVHKDKKAIATLLLNNYSKIKLSIKYFFFILMYTTISFVIAKLLFKPIYFILLRFVLNFNNVNVSEINIYFVRTYLLILVIQFVALLAYLFYIFDKDIFMLLNKLNSCKNYVKSIKKNIKKSIKIKK